MSFTELVAKARSGAVDTDILPILEIAKARRTGSAQKYPRDASGAFIIPGATVSVTFDDGTSATGDVKSTSADSVTVSVGGKNVQGKLETVIVTVPAGVDDAGFDELDREDAARVAWLSGKWPTGERLTQLREQQREQPPESWVLHDKELGSSVDATLPAQDVPVEADLSNVEVIDGALKSKGKKKQPNPKRDSSSTYDESKHPRGAGGKWTTLRAGSSGDGVRAVQSKLNVKSAADGKYDEATKKAVLAFQRKHGLQVDGVVGTQTVAALRGDGVKVAPGKLTEADRKWLRKRGSRA